MVKENSLKLPESVLNSIEHFRSQYRTSSNDVIEHEIVRLQAYWYTKALMDAKYITDSERQVLFLYITEL